MSTPTPVSAGDFKSIPPPWKIWLLAARPRTLTAALAPILVGSAVGSTTVTDPASHLWVSVLALASALCIQIGTNLVNDAADFEAGADDADRLGPARACQMGWLTPGEVKRGAVLAFALAVVLGLPLVLVGGRAIVWIGALSVVAGYAYTAGPFPLAYLGLGEVFVVLFFGLVAVGGVTYLWNSQATNGLPTLTWLAGTQIGLLGSVLLAINNFRDLEGDRRSAKQTLAARFGTEFARAEITFLILAPFVLGAIWAMAGYPWATFLPLVILPLAVRIVRSIRRDEPGRQFNAYLGMSAMLQLVFSILCSVGILLG